MKIFAEKRYGFLRLRIQYTRYHRRFEAIIRFLHQDYSLMSELDVTYLCLRNYSVILTQDNQLHPVHVDSKHMKKRIYDFNKPLLGTGRRMAEENFSLSDDYEVPALLLEEIVLFPHMEVALTLQEKRDLAALEQALREHHLLAFIPSSRSQSNPATIGVLVLVRKSNPSHDGARQVILKGLWRIKVKNFAKEDVYTKIRFERVNETENDSNSRLSVMKKVHGQIDEFVKLIPEIPIEIISLLKSVETSGKLADLCAYSPNFTYEERLDLLNTLNPEERLKKVSKIFEGQLNTLRSITEFKPIPDCETCMDLADKAFDSDPVRRGEIVLAFLNHVIKEHTGELLGLLAEKYGPIFMRKRALR